MQVSILGPVEVVRDGQPVPVGGARVRRLLARLALEAGRPVGPDALADAVWGEDVPAEIPNALQSLVSRLRRALGDPALVQPTPGGGYRLALTAEAVDAVRFERAVEPARRRVESDPAAAVTELEQALALWRGEPLADLDTDGPAAGAIARLDGLRRGAAQSWLDALIRVGRTGEAVTELTALLESDPTDEQVAVLLMRALAASGRPAEALTVYERVRTHLADTLGVDPSTELRQQHLTVLQTQDEPLTPVTTTQSNLPAAVSSFVGRETDLERLRTMAEASRLVTLVGPGGSGKTRLAVEAAHRAAPLVPDGVWLVELAKVNDPADVITAVIDVVGAWDTVQMERPRLTQQLTPLDRLGEALRSRDTVLVLDNCEHLLEAVAELVDRLLATCPRLHVLTTSREPLAVPGEALCPVPPLAHDTSDLPLDEIRRVPAVALFVDRVAAVQPDFVLAPGNVEAVAEICRRLDGLPLALELAAARTRSMPVDQIASRLGDRFRLLTGGSRTALPRHRTLRAVVEWSWGLLSDQERDLVERLAVFSAGISPEAARHVVDAAGGDADDAEDLVAALVDKSLLQLRDGPRYRMLETIREFGTDRLAERSALVEARRVHADYFHDLARRIEPLVRTRDQLRWVRLAGLERDNFLTALQLLCDAGEADRAVTLASSLSWLWTLRGEHNVVTTWLARALEVPGGTWGADRVIATSVLAMNAGAVFGIAQGRELIESNAELLDGEPSADDPIMLNLVRSLTPMFLGDHDLARRRVDSALVVARDEWERATLLMMRAFAEENDGDIDAMRATLVQAETGFEELGERFGLASVLEGRARLQALDGDLDAAIDSHTRAGRLTSELGAEDDAGQSWLWAAQLRMRKGDLDGADREVARARERFEHIGSWLGLIMADSTASNIARRRGEFAEARRLAESSLRRYQGKETTRGPGQLLALCMVTLALAALSLDDEPTATACLASARHEAIEVADMPVVAMTTVGFASLAATRGERAAAADLLGAADAIRGNPDPTDPDIVALEATLAEWGEDFLERRRVATRLSRDDAVKLLLGTPPSADSVPATPDALIGTDPPGTA